MEICGGVASGKTTLAMLMSSEGCLARLENFRANPFWSLFYKDPSRYAFETEITFLLQHYHAINNCDGVNELLICDFSPLLDLAYADVNLKGSQYDAFYAVYSEVKRSLPPPVLLVHLRCGAEEELRRIRARNRTEESQIDTSYLSALNSAVARRVKEASAELRVLEIDSEVIDFAHDPVARRQVSKQVLSSFGTPAEDEAS